MGEREQPWAGLLELVDEFHVPSHLSCALVVMAGAVQLNDRSRSEETQ